MDSRFSRHWQLTASSILEKVQKGACFFSVQVCVSLLEAKNGGAYRKDGRPAIAISVVLSFAFHSTACLVSAALAIETAKSE